MNEYVSLHSHSSFSTLDGMCSPDEMAQRAKSLGMKALAITDHGTMSGLPEFYVACKANGIKPILGIESYMVLNHKEHVDVKSPTGRNLKSGFHICLLAKNYKGYKNLVALNNLAFADGFYYRPKIDFELLKKHHEGLIVGSACIGSEIGQECLGGTDDNVVKIAHKFKEVFGDDYYIELQDNQMMRSDAQRNVNSRLMRLRGKIDVPFAATTDSHYLDSEDRKVHDVVVAIGFKKTLKDPAFTGYDGLYHMKTPDELAQSFEPDVLRHTLKVAERVEDFEIFSKEMHLPVFVQNADEMLKMISESGLISKGLNKPQYVERLHRELGVIAQIKMAPYMLTVKEIVDMIRRVGCPLGWGRGSAGGSLVCYVLGITNIDPIKYGLLFERFLNVNRPDYPDIDIDVAQERRGEVIKAIMQKYGEDKVAHLSTNLSMRPKILVRDICRVLGEKIEVADKLSRLVPESNEDGSPIENVENLEGTEFEKELLKDNQGRFTYDCIKTLMGLTRHVGVHASGLVISALSIPENLPIRREDDKNVIQYTMHHIDKFGFLKFDLLGLKTLDAVYKTAEEVGLVLADIPEDDAKTYQLINEGQVLGVFQLDGSRGGTDLCKKIKPQNVKEIADLLAINRPGVLDAGLLQPYLRRRNGLEAPSYVHPDLEQVLKSSYGICIYQEDMMNMAVKYAGYTLAEAENLRKGVAKKNTEIISQHKKMFLEKATALGRKPEDTEKILSQIEAAGRYSFNKSHAVGYAHLTYVCAYMSANYPLHFFKNLLVMSADVDRADYLAECLMRKLPVFPPDVNLSDKDVSIQKREVINAEGKVIEEEFIRLGLLSMKGIGESYAQKLIDDRPYVSMEDCVKKLSKSIFTILYSSNGFGSIPDKASFSSMMKVDEAKVLGIVLSGEIAEYQDVIDFIKAVPTYAIGATGNAVITVLDVKKTKDKNEDEMAFVKATDIFGPELDPDLIMFASVWAKEQHPKKNMVYGAVLSRLPNGSLQIKALDTIEEIRSRIKVKKT